MKIVVFLLELMFALVATPVTWFLRAVSTGVRRVATSSRAVTRKLFAPVCVDPYCRDRGDHSSHR
jgi:hypothetical protein